MIDNWKHRRSMAYAAAVGALLIFPILCYANPEMMALANPYYGFCGAVLVAYKGMATLEDIKGKK